METGSRKGVNLNSVFLSEVKMSALPLFLLHNANVQMFQFNPRWLKTTYTKSAFHLITAPSVSEKIEKKYSTPLEVIWRTILQVMK